MGADKVASELGVVEHVASAGRPLQLIVGLIILRPLGEMWIVTVVEAELPAVTDTVLGDADNVTVNMSFALTGCIKQIISSSSEAANGKAVSLLKDVTKS